MNPKNHGSNGQQQDQDSLGFQFQIREGLKQAIFGTTARMGKLSDERMQMKSPYTTTCHLLT